MTWVLPAELYSESWPPVPSLPTTRLGTVCPAVKLRLAARGRGTPAGKGGRWLAGGGPVGVTFSTTADPADAGTPPRPLTCRFMVAAWPSGPGAPPVPFRVSRMRAGVTG